MAKVDDLVRQFLALKRIAVVGVSDRRETGSNSCFRKFKQAGHEVYPINPRLGTFDGNRCYPDLKSIPVVPEGVFILANPKVADAIVDECIDLGIKYVWMHCMMGTKPGLASGMTSVSPEAVRKARENGVTVIAGSCPNQFLHPDFGHSMMRVLWRTLGFMKANGAAAPRPS
jgi:hypothetical protein